ncbi:sensor histidine kinase [Celeribacter sp. ASW11-22]|nr:sensor histidine kinase [Celeribacter litoreus]
MLAIALLPIGLIAMLQNVELAREANRRDEANLISRTSSIAAEQEDLLQRAVGAAQVIGTMAPTLSISQSYCERTLQGYLAEAQVFTFAGFVDAEGHLNCTSNGADVDISALDSYQQMRDAPRIRARLLTRSPAAPTIDSPEILLSVPVLRNGNYDGHSSITFRQDLFLSRLLEDEASDHPNEIVIFNADGDILASDLGMDGIEDRLPLYRPLEMLASDGEQVFRGRSRAKDDEVFSVVSMIPGAIYALAIWTPPTAKWIAILKSFAAPLLFPVIMWGGSLLVAYFAVERLVIRPIRHLRARMLVFMRSRTVGESSLDRHTPAELLDMEETWNRLTESVLHDEAELEDMVREKAVLLKEVHHRVKNNLQLISSMLGLRLRKAKSEDAKAALKDIQGRVMSLATVHQSLSQTSEQSGVAARDLTRAIVQNVIAASRTQEMSFQVEEDYETFFLFPDQAVPLSLIVSEGLTNAIKYIGYSAEGIARLKISLREEDEGLAVLEIANTVGERLVNEEVSEGTGMGSRFIGGFVSQLGGRIEVDEADGWYKLRVHFPIAEFDEAAGL